MFRLLRPMVALVVLSVTTPALASDKPEVVAPTAAVAAAWAKEAPKGPSSTALKALYGSYARAPDARHGFTIKARQQGAREVNPMMSGNYGGNRDQGVARRGHTMAA